jgi:SAM-dependent methyltransferase
MSEALRRRLYRTYYSASYGMANPTDDTGFQRRVLTLRQLLLPWLPRDREARIVDVGCGIGYAVAMLIQAGYSHVEGVDLSDEQVQVALRRGLPVRQADAFAYLAGHRETLDAVLALDFIEHLTRDELMAFLDLVRDALRPGGRLIVKTPNANAPTAARSLFRDLTHEWIFTEHSLHMALAAGGLRPLAIWGERVRPGGVPGALRCALGAVTRTVWRLFLVGELGWEAVGIPLEFNLLAVAEKPMGEGGV